MSSMPGRVLLILRQQTLCLIAGRGGGGGGNNIPIVRPPASMRKEIIRLCCSTARRWMCEMVSTADKTCGGGATENAAMLAASLDHQAGLGI